MNKILVVAAHPDDEILGLGGTIRKYINRGYKAECFILGEGQTSRNQNGGADLSSILKDLKADAGRSGEIIGYSKINFLDLPDNKFDTVALLNITKAIESYIADYQPDIVYTHHYGDLNIDHRITFEAVLTACRPVGDYTVKEIYCFETPSSTEWNFKYGEASFKPNVFIDIGDTMECKLKAMECYTSEIREYPHPRSLKALEIIAARWGTVVGTKYAEAFELIRKVD